MANMIKITKMTDMNIINILQGKLSCQAKNDMLAKKATEARRLRGKDFNRNRGSITWSGLVCSKDGSMTYFVKRFDRVGRGGKVAVEDFAQLSGHGRETKYHSSMERVAHIIFNPEP